MISSAILGRYARSLAEVVFEDNIEPKITEDLAIYSEIFRAVPALLDAFHSPAVPSESKEKLLSELMSRYPVSPVASNFLRILLQHNRIRYFEDIRESYQKSINERKGIVTATITSAAPLSERELKALEVRLSGITGKVVNVAPQTDADLLGGIVVQMGSTIYDGSVRTQLTELKRRLSEA
ncbi:MAG: synthase delta chain [Acidobacteria bacterium]|nr:synthase delta chain [Acidobacteriota bacterium]